jgi:bacteriophage HK97-gp10 putative tail-component
VPSSEFRVTDATAPRRAVQPDIRNLAEHLAADAAARTPIVSGRMAGAWLVEDGKEPGTSVVTNPTPYARFVEYGTRYMPAEAPLGKAMARARGGGG